MAEQYARRMLIYAHSAASPPNTVESIRRLNVAATPREVPAGIWRGDVAPPANPEPYARWYRATDSSGAGAGEWYSWDPFREVWLSDEPEVMDFYHNGLNGLPGNTIPPAHVTPGEGGIPLLMSRSGLPVETGWGYPLIGSPDLMLVAIAYKHDLTVTPNVVRFALGINGVLASGPPQNLGFVNMGLVPGQGRVHTRATPYPVADGTNITGYLTTTGGSGTTVSSGSRFQGRAVLRRYVPAAT